MTYDPKRATATDHVIPAKYPLGEEVPKGGSSCASCHYLSSDGDHCRNKRYQDAMGTSELGAAADRYCCMYWRGA